MDEALGALLAEYADGPRRLREALQTLAPNRRDVRPGPGRWSAREVALHLCDSEVVTVFRMKRALGEPGAAVPAFNQDGWIQAAGAAADLELWLGAFAALRLAMADLVRHLPAEAWERSVAHEVAGPRTVRQLLEGAVAHTRHHLEQIRAAGDSA